MSKVPEFNFDFSAVEGQPFEEAAVALFKQLEAHYNKHIKPAPILFGKAAVARPSIVMDSTPPGPNPFHQEYPSTPAEAENIIQMQDGYEIKMGEKFGLKENTFILDGVTADGVEVFDKLITTGPPWPLIVEGEAGKYNLGTAK